MRALRLHPSLPVASIAALMLSVFAACGGSGGDADDPGAGPGGPGSPNGEGGEPPPKVPPGCENGACSYCAGKTWGGGAAPTAATDVVVRAGQTVVVDCPAEARTITIEEGGTLFGSRETSSTLTAHGNVVVKGMLDYGTPDGRIPEGITAEIVFTGMKDDAFVGTPSRELDDDGTRKSARVEMKVLAEDVGLWVMGKGKFRAAGQEKRAWGRLTEGAGPGDATFTIDDASGWKVGDRITLTPTAARSAGESFASQFDEGTIASVDGNTVTIAPPPKFVHAGCTDCTRRGEAANLSRNVVIRSADDSAHAHVMIAEAAVAQIDSAELRWLGPEKCGGPDRRAALWFHEQDDASDPSFVRHAAIWGGNKSFVIIERSNGVEVRDVAGYDGYGSGFVLFYDTNPCGTRCDDRNTAAPKNTVFDHILAAKVGVSKREDGCLRVDHRMAAIDGSGAENSGVRDSVAVGIGWEGSGEDVAGFGWAEGGSGRPQSFVFTNNVTHNSRAHGAMVWHNSEDAVQAPYTNNTFWSTSGYGVHWGAYANPFQFLQTTVFDTAGASLGVKAVPTDDRLRVDGATVEDMKILAYVFVQDRPAIFKNVTFTGVKKIGLSQLHDACPSASKESDPNDPDCIRNWIRLENPKFAAGMVPFEFGGTPNKHTIWEIRGFSSPDYPNLPSNFDLYRADNHVAGGSYVSAFDAWLVPR